MEVLQNSLITLNTPIAFDFQNSKCKKNKFIQSKKKKVCTRTTLFQKNKIINFMIHTS